VEPRRRWRSRRCDESGPPDAARGRDGEARRRFWRLRFELATEICGFASGRAILRLAPSTSRPPDAAMWCGTAPRDTSAPFHGTQWRRRLSRRNAECTGNLRFGNALVRPRPGQLDPAIRSFSSCARSLESSFHAFKRRAHLPETCSCLLQSSFHPFKRACHPFTPATQVANRHPVRLSGRPICLSPPPICLSVRLICVSVRLIPLSAARKGTTLALICSDPRPTGWNDSSSR
jgi:hypothetical protein